MPAPQIHGTHAAFSASEMLDHLGKRIATIRDATPKMTWADVGAAFGKSDDVAASYAAGLSDMPLSAFLRGTAAFGPYFADVALSFVGHRLCAVGAVAPPDGHAPVIITAALLKLARAVLDGSPIDDGELVDAAPEILDLGFLVDALRDRLALLGIGGDA